MARLADLTWREAQARGESGAVLIVPVGSTEQHGPHLPLSTDTTIATAIAARAALRLTDALVAPPLPYGSSGEHDAFAGTLSIGQDAVESVLIEVVRSASATFACTALVCAHGGNLAPMSRACDLLRNEGRDVLLWWPNWRGDAHAGRAETSLMLAIDPGAVALELASAGNAMPIGLLMGELKARGVRHVSPNGVLGDPAGASTQEGARLLEAAVEDLVATVTARTGMGS